MIVHKKILLTFFAFLLCVASYGATEYDYIVKKSYPHSTTSYTQGLQIVDGELYESTGNYGESRLMQIDMESGKAIRTITTLPRNQFGEGITILDNIIYMLTWREGMLHIFDRLDGKKIETKYYSGEGWGLTSDGNKLYMSDGSCKITIRDPKSFQILESHIVTLNDEPLAMLNELEWIDGQIWANVYTTNRVVIIDPTTWRVVGVINFTGLLPTAERTPQTDVLNGIAYDEATKKIYVTGKNWSRLFEVEIVER